MLVQSLHTTDAPTGAETYGDLLTTLEVMEIFKLKHAESVRQMVRRRELQAVRVHRRLLIPRASVEAFIKGAIVAA